MSRLAKNLSGLGKNKKNIPNEENPRCNKRQRTSTSFGLVFFIFLLKNEPQTFKKLCLTRKHNFRKRQLIVR